MLINFFNRLSKNDWSQPISLTESGRKYHLNLPKDRLPIITSIKPNQNSARNISKSTAEIVKKEISLGTKLIHQIQKGELAWEKLFEPPKLNQTFQGLLMLEVRSKNSKLLEFSLGYLEGHIFSLILNLEQLNISLRPWPSIKTQQTTGQILIEIQTLNDMKTNSLDEIFASFSKKFYEDCPTGTKLNIKMNK